MATILVKEKLSAHKAKTPEGYLICQDAILARTGKQTYLKSEIYPCCDDTDMVEVDRKAEQVFCPETLASFEDKPITVEHPNENVGPENYSELAVGHTRNIRKGKVDGQDVMIGDLIITDASVIEDIENGVRTELSCGYDCDITEGAEPEQINIRGNHVALCECGRAGCAKIIDSIDKTILAKLNDADLNKFLEWYEHEKKPTIGDSSVSDSVSRGTFIQEFGKQGDQYKIIKIEKNTIYAEEVNLGKLVLFKKDKEGIDWDIIKKSEINDSAKIKPIEKDTIEEIKNLLSKYDLEPSDISKDENKTIKINFENFKDGRKAIKVLKDKYDVELDDSTNDVMVYDVFVKDATYSRKFYIKELDLLKKKLNDLERNGILNSHNDDYDDSKNDMKKTIQRQIEKYEKLLNNSEEFYE